MFVVDFVVAYDVVVYLFVEKAVCFVVFVVVVFVVVFVVVVYILYPIVVEKRQRAFFKTFSNHHNFVSLFCFVLFSYLCFVLFSDLSFVFIFIFWKKCFKRYKFILRKY